MSVFSGSFKGNSAKLARVEAVISSGGVGVQVVGAGAHITHQGRERARVALEALGYRLPPKRIIMGVNPAEQAHDGPQFDLALAIRLYCLGSGLSITKKILFVAELDLDGTLLPVRGIISYAVLAAREKFDAIVVSHKNSAEIQKVLSIAKDTFEGIEVKSFYNLYDTIAWLSGENIEMPVNIECLDQPELIPTTELNFLDMNLSEIQIRLATVVAHGHHSLFMSGPPGCGKTMFAKRLPSLLENMNADEHLTAIDLRCAFQDQIDVNTLSGRPDFRSPHHSSSAAAILGSSDFPGEVTFAHGGVLFMDEFAEFRRDVLEGLREPLEAKEVHICRSKQRVVWPANFLFIAAANPCPCGWYGSHKRMCSCLHNKLKAYQQRISGPIAERMDIYFEAQESAHIETYSKDRSQEKLNTIYDWLQQGHQMLQTRKQNVKNSQLSLEQVMDASGNKLEGFQKLLQQFIPSYFSSRSRLKILRVARSLADIELSPVIKESHLKQSMQWQYGFVSHERGDRFLAIS